MAPFANPAPRRFHISAFQPENLRRTGIGKYYAHPKLQNKYAFIVALVVFLSINMAFISFVVTLLATMKDNGGTLSLYDSSFHDLIGSLIFRGSAIFLVCCGLGFLITIFLSHRFVGPITRIKTVVDNLTKGLPQEDIHLRTNDELNDLAQAVNRLSKKLR